MSEWWTYRLSSFMLFSPRTYERLLERYNVDIWPLQCVTLALGIVLVVLLYRRVAHRERWIAAILAACWLWVAWAFLWHRYATVNWAASYFALAFAVEALLLSWLGVVRNGLRWGPIATWKHRAGVAIVVLALAGPPLVGVLLGRPLARLEVFGALPDPTAIATLAILMLASQPVRWPWLAIPLLWCAISGATQWALHAPDALVTPLLGTLVVLLAAVPGRRQTSIVATSGK